MKKALILTAKDIETEAVKTQLIGPLEKAKRTDEHFVYTVWGLRSRDEWGSTLPDIEIALYETGRGQDDATIYPSSIVRNYRPDLVLYVGCAGGVAGKTSIGDIYIATNIWNYEPASEDKRKIKPKGHPIAPDRALLDEARAVNEFNLWRERIRAENANAPNVIFAPIASGQRVIKHDESVTWRFVQSLSDEILACETEGHGFIASLSPLKTHSIMIRGISDNLIGKDLEGKEHDDNNQLLATKYAAAFACQIIEDFDHEIVRDLKGSDSRGSSNLKNHVSVEMPRELPESVERESLIQLEHFEREITGTLAFLDNHAKLIAEDSVILEFLIDRNNESAQLKAHQVLVDHAGIGPYATTFLLSPDGICIENSRHKLSIGKDYSFRPYFKDAMQHKIGRFAAIGVTSGALGHHVAYPVRQKGGIIGVACVEVDMEHISTQSNAFVHMQTRHGDRSWVRVLADQNGVIMLSSEETWIYRAVETIPEETRQVVLQTRQYPGKDLAAIEQFVSPDTQPFSSLMPNITVRGLRWTDTFGDVQNQVFAIREKQIAGGWRVMIYWRLPIPS